MIAVREDFPQDEIGLSERADELLVVAQVIAVEQLLGGAA